MASPRIETVTGSFAIPVLDASGKQIETITVDAAEFGGKISPTLLHEAVLMYEANQRAGTHSTLRRSEVAGSTKKLFKQKGTGNARVGNKRTNKRRGGGTAKGPKPRDYSYALPRKAMRSATRMAILAKIRDGEAVVIDQFGLAEIKTKAMATVLNQVVATTSAAAADAPKKKAKPTTMLIGTGGIDSVVYKSARNLPGVQVLPASDFNTYAVLRPARLVLTRDALEALRNPQPKAKPEAA
ncbi:MAG: 50S ribosomal protein L4 [Zavarzinella sp.]